MKPSTREWIKKAESDYQAALALARRRKISFYDQACFLCQQSAEKYLKARPAIEQTARRTLPA
jgi:HEPN domain-containing protein